MANERRKEATHAKRRETGPISRMVDFFYSGHEIKNTKNEWTKFRIFLINDKIKKSELAFFLCEAVKTKCRTPTKEQTTNDMGWNF